MANDYETLANAKLAIGMTTSDRDALVMKALAAASRGIDDATGRRFWLDQSASPRVFTPRSRVLRDGGTDKFLVDDIGDDTGLVVEVGSTSDGWTAVTDYETDPENALATGKPISAFVGARGIWWPRVRVTARWGWPAIPDVVVQATLIQTLRLYRRKDSPEGVAGSADWGAVRVVRIDPDVQALIQHLVLPGFG